MSLKKLDLSNKSTQQGMSKNSLYFNQMQKNNHNSISTMMTNFLESITKAREAMQKEIDKHNSTIINFQKNRRKIKPKRYVLSMSSTKFPLISTNKNQNLSQNPEKLNDDIHPIMKHSSMRNNNIIFPDKKKLKKSNSDFNLYNSDNNHLRSNLLFKTSIFKNNELFQENLEENLRKKNKTKTVHFNFDSDEDNYHSDNNNNIEIEKIIENENENSNIEKNNINENEKENNEEKKRDSNDNNIEEDQKEELKEKESNQNTEERREKKLKSIIKNKNDEIIFVKRRKKTFKVDVIRGWEFQNGLNFNNVNEKGYIEDKEYQKNLISNQIDIIMDNTNYFKLNFINKLEPYIHNDDLNPNFLQKLNKLIEETASIYVEIGHLIIRDLEQFIFLKYKLPFPSPKEMVEGAEVSDEKIEFEKDIKILNYCSRYLTSSFDIYLILNSQLSNYYLPAKTFRRVRHFLNRARYNMNSVILISRKFIEEINYEKGIVNQFNEQKEIIAKNGKIRNTQYYNLDKFSKNGFDFLNGINKNSQNVIGKDKIRRLNNLLNEKNKKLSQKRNNGKHIDLENKMFNKIVEYMDPNIKERFEALSVTQKKDKNKNLRKVFKFNF